jgi:microcystin-dependent protein
MSEPFLSELKLVSFNFPPKGWAMCNGQLLPINQNQALFSLLGTTYGGDGRVNFGLPNLQGRVPAHMGGGFTLGQRYGEETHTLSISELPQHSHPMRASSGNPTQNAPNNAVYADTGSVQGLNIYRSGNPAVGMSASAITNVGGSQPHLNDQPYLVLNWIIALQGIFPSQN